MRSARPCASSMPKRRDPVQISFHKTESRQLGRTMEYKRYGHAGRPMLVFPTSKGRFFQYEDFGAIGALSAFIEDGRIQSGRWTASTSRPSSPGTWTRRTAWPATTPISTMSARKSCRNSSLEAKASNGGRELKPLLSGCSMGAYHAANFLFHYPELASGVIALSGVYSTRDFFGSALEGGIYYHSPLDYLPGLNDEALLARLRASRMIFCCGQGAWEEPMLIETRELERSCATRKFPPGLTTGAPTSSHDWPWWHRPARIFRRPLARRRRPRRAGDVTLQRSSSGRNGSA